LEGSDFLVSLSNSEHGFQRVKLSDQTSATGSLSDYLPTGLSVQDLEVVRDSLYALFTFNSWAQTFVVNM
jgi:urocanate hydratase